MKSKRNPILTSFTVDDIMKGNFKPLANLIQFVKDVVCGPTSHPSSSKKVRVDSIVADLGYASSNGRKSTGNTLLLDLL